MADDCREFRTRVSRRETPAYRPLPAVLHHQVDRHGGRRRDRLAFDQRPNEGLGSGRGAPAVPLSLLERADRVLE
jgi:hypothetical protein